MATTYLYSVMPKKPIRFLCGVAVVPPIRTPRSLQMTVEQVKDCLKYGSVYRRFAEEGRNERVTTVNVERLHNDHFIPEEEFNAIPAAEKVVEEVHVIDTKRGNAEISVEVEPATEVVETEEATEVKDEIQDESTEEAVTEDTVEENIDEESDDEIQDEVVEEEIAEEETITDDKEISNEANSYSNKNQYYNKNHKKNRH